MSLFTVSRVGNGDHIDTEKVNIGDTFSQKGWNIRVNPRMIVTIPGRIPLTILTKTCFNEYCISIFYFCDEWIEIFGGYTRSLGKGEINAKGVPEPGFIWKGL
jgi:hypothetical protein